MGGTPNSFYTKLNVLVENSSELTFENIHFQTYYNYGYMQYTISIIWEDDKRNPTTIHWSYMENITQIIKNLSLIMEILSLKMEQQK